MNEIDYLGYNAVKPSNKVIAEIIEEWQYNRKPIDFLCRRYKLEEYLVREIINIVLIPQYINPQTITIKSRITS